MNASRREEGDRLKAAQRELFSTPEDSGTWKVFRGKGGVAILYDELPSGALRIDFGTGKTAVATRQSKGQAGNARYYLNDPRLGQIQQRGKRQFLAALAQAFRLESKIEDVLHDARAMRQCLASGIGTGPTRPRKRNTLCNEPEPMTWDVRVIIPIGELQGLQSDCVAPVFAACPSWLLERPETSHGEKIVYARLATYAGKNGVAWPSEYTLSKSVGMSRPQVQTILGSLKNRHMIREVGRGKRGVCKYEFLWHPWIEEWRQTNLTSQVTWLEPAKPVSPDSQVSWPKKSQEKRSIKEESSNAPHDKRPPQTRALSSQDEQARFARWYDPSSPADWVVLCDWLGKEEMITGTATDRPSGAMWLGRYEVEPALIDKCLARARREEAENGKPAANRGSALNAIFKDERKKW